MNNQNASRKYAIIVAVMLILAAVYAVKLFSLQVISKDYKEAAAFMAEAEQTYLKKYNKSK